MHQTQEFAAKSPKAFRPLDALAAPFQAVIKNWSLVRALVLRDLEASLRGTSLGWAWMVLLPLIMLAVYTFIFGVIFGSQWRDRDPVPFQFPMLYFSGLILFGFFTTCISRAPGLMRENATYLRQIIFPVHVLIPVIMGAELIKLMVGLALLLLAYVPLLGIPPVSAISYPITVMGLFLFTAGISWTIAAVAVYVRDLVQAMAPVSMVLLFLSPMFYPLSQVPEPLRPIFLLNPLAFPLESTRNALFFGEWPSLIGAVIYLSIGLLVAAAGLALFQRIKPGFVDVL